MQIEPLLFPVNFVRHSTLVALELFFDRINVICPTEDPELSPCRAEGVSTPLYINRIVPVPLDKKIKRFKKMLDQMRIWGQQMGLDNKSVAEAVHTEAFQPAGESITSILSSIKQQKNEDPLMSSRVFLQIALENDLQDDSLDMELKKLESKKRELTDIMGGDPHEEDPTVRMNPEHVPSNLYGIKMLNMPERRLNAWMKLASRYKGTPLQSWPVGQSVAVKDLMDKAYEKATGKIALELMNIHLPGENDSPELKAKLHDGISKLMGYLQKELKDGGSSQVAEDELITNICHRLEVSVDRKKVEKNPGPVFNLTLYPGMHMDDLLPLAAGVKKRKRPPQLFANWCYGAFYLL